MCCSTRGPGSQVDGGTRRFCSRTASQEQRPCLPAFLPACLVEPCERWSLWAHQLYMNLGTCNIRSALLSPLVKSWQTQGGTQGEVWAGKSHDFLVGSPRTYLWEFKSVRRIIHRRELKKIDLCLKSPKVCIRETAQKKLSKDWRWNTV